MSVPGRIGYSGSDAASTGTSASERSPSLRWVQQSVARSRSQHLGAHGPQLGPAIHDALGAAPGHSA